MSGQFAADRVRQLIQTLFDGIAQRVDGELGLAESFERENVDETERYKKVIDGIRLDCESESAAVQAEYDKVSSEAGMEYQAHYSAASEEYDEALRATNSKYEELLHGVKTDFEETRWMVVSYFDENAGGSPKQQFEQFEHNVENSREHLETQEAEMQPLYDSVIEMLKKRRMWTEPDLPRPTTSAKTSEVLLDQFAQAGEDVRSHAVALKRQKLPMLFSGLIPLFVFLLMTGGIAAVAYLFVDLNLLGINNPTMEERLGILGLSGAALTIVIQGILFGIARSGAESSFLSLAQARVDATAAMQLWNRLTTRELARRRKEFDTWYNRLCEERDSRLQKAQEKHDTLTSEYTHSRTEELQKANSRYPALMKSITEKRDVQLQAAQDRYPPRLKKLQERFNADQEEQRNKHKTNLEHIRQRYEFDWQNMSRTWHAVVDGVRTSSERITAEVAPVSQKWTDLAFGNWAPATQIPPGVRVGDFKLSLSDVEYGVPEDERLIPEQTEFSIPAMLPFPEKASLVIRSPGSEAREAAVDLLRVAMLRLLTTLPPGKIRFTIIDPIGLGENFSAFMHLADYDELLVTSRIWTEAVHIEQRLADLTEHMETVFQTYLRNEFKTIEEYNDFAGEVAEPYHILVVAGFPASISEQAARRLTSIMTSGPRCGVYTLMNVDTQMSLPQGFNLENVEYEATTLSWDDGQFSFSAEDLNWLTFNQHRSAEAEEFSRIVKRVGDESKDARRVEVSFERVVPREIWQLDSRGGLDVPLGRAGATKLQHMRLGKGTSQHVLIAGKTGSGKSTLMHILVTNLVLHYNPDEVEFYLIDFKKGVEFKTYAANQLPHARVIAIESDREFGLSVLERLDGILKERGDLFRSRSVQDIAGFRNGNPERMPRIMLLIDEFQEFFTEDDRISQQAALLLDRLVRQGRAFGMHVMLGSQTLGGAYSLARSTLGQVAVRIALQCSESDAHLILSEENTAARLLTRPGEAIYNDANGLLEGNHPFQIAWLDDDKRDGYLQRIKAASDEQDFKPELSIVFEGNVPADALNNRNIVGLFDSDSSCDGRRVLEAWLGEAVAIKPHTAIRFRRLSGANLLVIGQSPNGARGILSTVFLSVVGQTSPLLPDDAIVFEEADQDVVSDDASPVESDAEAESSNATDTLEAMKSFSFAEMKIDAPESPAESKCEEIDPPGQFYILDGELADEPDVEFWRPIAESLPHDVRVGGPREAARFVAEISAELKNRGDADLAPPIVIVIDNIGRFRDLRRDEDDYSFSADRGKAASPAKQFVEILKEGPAVGIHTVIWSDTFNNAGRWMTSQTMRELELRVAFQMSATDSSNFIDTPVAARLGQNRALLYLVETGTLEKFRPYGLPSDELLQIVRNRFPVDAPHEHVTDDEGDSVAVVSDDTIADAGTEESMPATGDGLPVDGSNARASEKGSASADPAVDQQPTADESSDDDDEPLEACDDLSSWTII